MVTDISSYNFVMHQSIPSISSFILFINVTILVNNLRYLSTKKVVPIEICLRDLIYSYCFIDLVSEREHKKFCLSIYFQECTNYCYNMHMHIVTFIYMIHAIHYVTLLNVSFRSPQCISLCCLNICYKQNQTW